jgi:hypothetical protein
MVDRVLKSDPPSPGYRQVGLHCIYHEQQGRLCHNPLDCDLVPIWALDVEHAQAAFAVQREIERLSQDGGS